MSDDLDISAILAATSITSITGQPSKSNPPPRQQDTDLDRGRGKGKEKVRDGQFSSDNGKGRAQKGGNEPIFHTVSFADTLEGIAVKYGVQDLFARKELVIPSPEELEEQTVRPRRSYEKDITFEKDTPKYIYPATPEDEVSEQRRSLLGFSYNFPSGGEDGFGGLNTDTGAGVRIKQMGAKVRRRLEEEEDQLYGL
ncbi:uncharacterized protein ACA1_091750 [Acanthamoeba castellanii str. Neff]|uniref:Uncharacterized protein n=1 Tax=Acanthamoeba castellanii (strain ATCC 30010 / Neff) TaxID=1257118 RepID=L8GHX8_ACACF|nr:uncharacterized protein ACA1_091750 [Acanthamoeba castellanii str. Neff]ELR12665.1 hypothetical protein ACA1_091750 [Acanthamoeba castellanii str. Neff]